MLHLEGSGSSRAEPLLLGRLRRGAEADRYPVVSVYQTDRDREIGELLPVEHGSGGFILRIGHARFGDARHRLRPGERCALGVVEQRAALASSRDQHKLFDRYALLQQLARMHVDAEGAAGDLRDAEEDEVDQGLR